MESADAKGSLPGYVTAVVVVVVVVVSARDESSGVTVGARFCQVTSVLQEDSCKLPLLLLLSSTSHIPKSGKHLTAA